VKTFERSFSPPARGERCAAERERKVFRDITKGGGGEGPKEKKNDAGTAWGKKGEKNGETIPAGREFIVTLWIWWRKEEETKKENPHLRKEKKKGKKQILCNPLSQAD